MLNERGRLPPRGPGGKFMSTKSAPGSKSFASKPKSTSPAPAHAAKPAPKPAPKPTPKNHKSTSKSAPKNNKSTSKSTSKPAPKKKQAPSPTPKPAPAPVAPKPTFGQRLASATTTIKNTAAIGLTGAVGTGVYKVYDKFYGKGNPDVVKVNSNGSIDINSWDNADFKD